MSNDFQLSGPRPVPALDNNPKPFHTGPYLQLCVKNGPARDHARNGCAPRTLNHLRDGAEAVLEHIDLPEDEARRLMEMGFLPGALIKAIRRAPFKDPRVFGVDGVEVALRCETAAHMILRASSFSAEASHEQLP